MTNKPPAKRQLYEIVSVRRSKPPFGAEGSDWYRYEITRGTSTIRGYRQGDLETVMTAVKENVVQLNERQYGNRGRDGLVRTSKKKPATDDSLPASPAK